MDLYICYALLAGCFTWLITMLGAATVIFFKDPDMKIMNIMLGFASGVMISASFWSLLEPAVSQCGNENSRAALIVVPAFLVGALFMWGTDRLLSLMRKKKSRVGNENESKLYMLILSITLHNIPEGLAVGVAFGALSGDYSSEKLMGAIAIALGIGLQNFPEGAAVSLPMRICGYSRLKSFAVGQASAVVEPLFAFIGAFAVLKIQSLMPFALSFAAGAMIIVAVHELIPDSQKMRNGSYSATFGIIGGFAMMMFLDIFFS